MDGGRDGGTLSRSTIRHARGEGPARSVCPNRAPAADKSGPAAQFSGYGVEHAARTESLPDDTFIEAGVPEQKARLLLVDGGIRRHG